MRNIDSKKSKERRNQNKYITKTSIPKSSTNWKYINLQINISLN